MQNQFERLKYTHQVKAIINVPVMIPVQCIIMIDGSDAEDPDDIERAIRNISYTNVETKIAVPQINPVPRDFYAEALKTVLDPEFEVEDCEPEGRQVFDEEEGEMVTKPNIQPLLPGELHEFQEIYIDEDARARFMREQQQMYKLKPRCGAHGNIAARWRHIR